MRDSAESSAACATDSFREPSLSWLVVPDVQSQDACPTKAIEVINSFAGSGFIDLTSRAIAAVVVPRPADRADHQDVRWRGDRDDGDLPGQAAYKLLIAMAGELVVAPNMTKVSYTLDSSFVPIARAS